MKEIQSLLTTLRTKPFFMRPEYAMEFESRLVKALDGELVLDPSKGSTGTNTLKVTNGVAQIDINGVICKRVGLPQEWLDILGICDLDNVDAQLKAAKSEESVKAVLLNVYSPGGYAMGNMTTANLLKNVGKESVVYSDMLNASAAYYISSQANQIIISPECEIGCVGTYATYITYEDQLKSDGVAVTILKSGEYKALGNPYKTPSDEDKAILQAQIDELGQEFRSTVLSKRSIKDEYLKGLTYNGEKAIKYGFADSFADDKEEIMAALAA